MFTATGNAASVEEYYRTVNTQNIWMKDRQIEVGEHCLANHQLNYRLCNLWSWSLEVSLMITERWRRAHKNGIYAIDLQEHVLTEEIVDKILQTAYNRVDG